MFRIATTLAFCLAGLQAAEAACPQELAIYADADKSLTVEFSPNDGGSMMASNVFRIVMANDVVLDGLVMWNNGLARPNGIVMHDCPDGDATGDELDACTIWEGVIYSVDHTGIVDFLPPERADAAEQLLLPDFGRAVRYSAIWGEGRVTVPPWDVLGLSGCQE